MPSLRPQGPSPTFAAAPATHQSYETTEALGPVGTSEHAPPRITSITNSVFGVGAVKSMLTWYELVVTSLVSTVVNVQKSTSLSAESVPCITTEPPASLTMPALFAVAQLPLGSPASTGHWQPLATGPAGYDAQPALQAPSAQTPALHVHAEWAGGGPLALQSALGSPSSTCVLQLSSLALQASATGVAAVQPCHLAALPSHDSLPEHLPKLLTLLHACETPSRWSLQGHDRPALGTHHLTGTEGFVPPSPASLPESPPASDTPPSMPPPEPVPTPA